MDIRHLRAFIAVAEHGTVSSAADVLRITQPALSRQITRLEQEFGFKLFARSGRRLLITPLGEDLIADCRNLLSHVSLLSDQAHALRRGELKVLRIATSALAIEGLFPAFLRRWEAHVPGVRIALIDADADKQLDMVERGDAHLAINVINVVRVDERRFACHLLPLFCVLAAYPRSMKIEPGDMIDINRLVDHPLLLPSTSFATRSIFDAACRLAGVRPNVAVESGAAHALLAMAEAGHGVAVIPSILFPATTALRVSRVTHRREPLNIAAAVLWDRRRALPQHAETFCHLLTQHVEHAFVIRREAKPAARRPGIDRRGARGGPTARGAKGLTPWT
jgi:DNA-binding transcriptional LysR family regulator